MKLSRKSEYACLALIGLARNYDQKLTRIADISLEQEIPEKYLGQILLLLKGAGYVRSISGSGGGYALAKPPAQITLAEIIRLIDGPLAPVRSASKYYYEKTPVEKNEKLMETFRDIRQYVSNKLEGTTIQSLL